jgi:hypothetical protein
MYIVYACNVCTVAHSQGDIRWSVDSHLRGKGGRRRKIGTSLLFPLFEKRNKKKFSVTGNSTCEGRTHKLYIRSHNPQTNKQTTQHNTKTGNTRNSIIFSIAFEEPESSPWLFVRVMTKRKRIKKTKGKLTMMIVHSFHQLKLNLTLVISSWNDNGVAVLPTACAVAVEAALPETEADSSAKTRAAVAVAIDEEDVGGEGKEVYDRERIDEVFDCFEDSDEEEEKMEEGADPLLEEAGRVEVEVKRDRVVDRLRIYDRSGDVEIIEEGLEGRAAD